MESIDVTIGRAAEESAALRAEALTMPLKVRGGHIDIAEGMTGDARREAILSLYNDFAEQIASGKLVTWNGRTARTRDDLRQIASAEGHLAVLEGRDEEPGQDAEAAPTSSETPEYSEDPHIPLVEIGLIAAALRAYASGLIEFDLDAQPLEMIAALQALRDNPAKSKRGPRAAAPAAATASADSPSETITPSDTAEATADGQTETAPEQTAPDAASDPEGDAGAEGAPQGDTQAEPATAATESTPSGVDAPGAADVAEASSAA